MGALPEAPPAERLPAVPAGGPGIDPLLELAPRPEAPPPERERPGKAARGVERPNSALGETEEVSDPKRVHDQGAELERLAGLFLLGRPGAFQQVLSHVPVLAHGPSKAEP